MESPNISNRKKHKDTKNNTENINNNNTIISEKENKREKKNFFQTLELETERIRNIFINHEFHKLDRTRSRINAPKVVSSDTESESDSEVFLSNKDNKHSSHHHHHHRKVTSPTSSNGATTTSPTHTSPTSPTVTRPTSNGLFAPRHSLLSSESKDIDYRGFLNLLVLLLIFISFRLVILNHLTYGVRIDLSLLTISEYHRWPGVLIGLSLNIFILFAYLIELAAAKRIFKNRFCYILRVINCTACIVIPSTSIVAFDANPASGIIVMIMICIYSMKLISYAYENSKQRNFYPDNSSFTWDYKDSTIYPNNLTLKSTYWYMLVPTLVYQLSYPRSERIRKRFLIRKIIEALFLSLLIFYMVEQYMVPLVQNSLKPMEQYDMVRIVERVMKLSLPNLYVWLLGFYVFFHLYLNIMAEITRFGDREFYRDWWNSTGLDYFWRTWNMPVHHWMVVLIYTPMRRRGWSKNWGYFMCFFVSAVFHELVISIPFHTIKLWAFFGIMSQMVLIALTKNLLNGSSTGNIIFWFSIVLGQPMIVLLYYRNFIQENPDLYPPVTYLSTSEGLKL
ncbi:diacylglycerol O-acyltransferase 1 [Tieghemostelium lacteum]|uniref:O-acyltransferase n=1 Tax=Tieghemostelium lacteum TaxID=361077 RepID=A0A152A3G1_TIELA|nr:diacylglycerol O-acyltransferase 1 [Tieghemostelium lacteum]|eukprot:KYR00645.1 diacylglycerol O-acyltransferase 1 [Tieghemostelium lacteum]